MPEIPIERWVFNETNAAQSYHTHGFFRYFGKLPAAVTKKALEVGVGETLGPVLDIMCGSGTTLVECSLSGVPAVGVDVNPLSVLVANVKNTPLPPQELTDTLCEITSQARSDQRHDRDKRAVDQSEVQLSLLEDITPPGVNGGRNLGYIEQRIPPIGRLDTWFTKNAQRDLAILFHCIEELAEGSVRDFFLVAALSGVRRASNASARTGRIFNQHAPTDVDPISAFTKRSQDMLARMEGFGKAVRTRDVRAFVADARATGLPDSHFQFVLCHPPYFALYRYSSDVLRFELEWARFERNKIAQKEIEDGFKTTRRETFEQYVQDLGAVFAEAKRVLRTGGMLCLVDNNSTFRDERLPVIERLIGEAEAHGLALEKHCVRAVKYAQASYHRSARIDKITAEDHLVFFRKHG